MAGLKGEIENVNPQRFSKQTKREITSEEEDEDVEDSIDEREIFGTTGFTCNMGPIFCTYLFLHRSTA